MRYQATSRQTALTSTSGIEIVNRETAIRSPSPKPERRTLRLAKNEVLLGQPRYQRGIWSRLHDCTVQKRRYDNPAGRQEERSE